MRVNDRRPPPQGMLVDPERDRVTIDGETVRPASARRYLVLNKPAGVVVTARDPDGRATIFDLMDEDARLGGRLFPVGRLDMASRGLLLLTDDGELAQRLTHARYRVPKEYVALVAGVPTDADLRRLRTGIVLEDGPTLPAQAELLRSGPGAQAEIRIVITEGRNRQVRRMLEAVGHPVKDLVRVAMGPLRLGRLKPGSWRRLRPQELEALRRGFP